MAVEGTAVSPARGHRTALEAVLALAAGLLLRWLLQPLLDGALPYLGLYLAAIALMLRQGLAATLPMLAAGALATEWIAPGNYLPAELWTATRPQRLLVFGVSCSIMLPLLLALRRSHARQHAAVLADRRLAQVVQQANDAIVSLDTQGRVLSWNPAAERIFGYSQAEVLGRPLTILGGDDQQRAQQLALVAEVCAGHTFTAEVTRCHKDGRPLRLRVSAAPMVDEAQRVVGVSGVLQDVDAYRRAEEALRDKEAVLSAFYDNAPVLMGVVELAGDDDILHLYDNRVTCELFGVPPGGTAQRLSSELGAPLQVRRRWIRHYRASLTLGPQRFDYSMQSPGEERHWMTATVCPLGPGPSGRERFCYVSEDITERKQAEQRLRDDDRHKDEFLAVLAHELRNPLSPLVTGVQLLRRQGADKEARERSLAMMDRQLGHMVRMVNDLLDISRITQGRMTLTRTPVALQSVVDDALEASRALLQAQGHRLSVGVDEGLVVSADPTRLAQVLSNLLNNAAKYTPHGGDIELTARRRGDSVALCVADNGIGIPADQLERVFELFAQVPDGAVRAMGGLGIGLAIARKLVELHGGTLEAASEGRGRGSHFTLTLPLVALPERPAAADDPARTQRLRLVVADDNRDAAQSLAELLQLEGHEVHVVHDGLSAVQAAQTLEPDVMLLDIGMPRLDGLQAAARIRADATGPGPLLVAISGWGQQADVQRAAAAGFDHHLTKPVRVEELRAVLPA